VRLDRGDQLEGPVARGELRAAGLGPRTGPWTDQPSAQPDRGFRRDRVDPRSSLITRSRALSIAASDPRTFRNSMSFWAPGCPHACDRRRRGDVRSRSISVDGERGDLGRAFGRQARVFELYKARPWADAKTVIAAINKAAMMMKHDVTNSSREVSGKASGQTLKMMFLSPGSAGFAGQNRRPVDRVETSRIFFCRAHAPLVRTLFRANRQVAEK